MKRLVIVRVNTLTDNETLSNIKQGIVKQLEDGVLVHDVRYEVITKHFKDNDDIEVIVKQKKPKRK